MIVDKYQGSTTTKVEISELININFSVALYDQLFNLTSILKSEKQIFEQLEAAPRKQKSDLYNASSFFIKNSTGEILLFKTTTQKAYSEI